MDNGGFRSRTPMGNLQGRRSLQFLTSTRRATKKTLRGSMRLKSCLFKTLMFRQKAKTEPQQVQQNFLPHIKAYKQFLIIVMFRDLH